jgi:aryl-alcohol dehydrogenase-like predicted oxidoreductase
MTVISYNYLGKSGLRVSNVSLGTMAFGAATSDAEARKMLDVARERGVNFIDTADAYEGGKSETAVGKLIEKDRDDWVLATKVGQQDGPPKRKMGLSRKWMMEAMDASLKRLRTDYVDIYYMHHIDWDTPMEESVRAIGDIIQAGKARYWGFSNHRGWQIGELVHLADGLGVPRPIIAQPMYNLVMRQVENDYLPACEYYGIGVAPFSPLARGVLTGKYDPKDPKKKPPKGSRADRGDNSILNRDFRPETFTIVETLRRHCEKRGMSLVDFAVLWVLNCRTVTSLIAGPRTNAQWQSYLDALKHEFKAEDEALVNSLVAAGHPSTPGFNEPRYPPMGRRARAG